MKAFRHWKLHNKILTPIGFAGLIGIGLALWMTAASYRMITGTLIPLDHNAARISDQTMKILNGYREFLLIGDNAIRARIAGSIAANRDLLRETRPLAAGTVDRAGFDQLAEEVDRIELMGNRLVDLSLLVSADFDALEALEVELVATDVGNDVPLQEAVRRFNTALAATVLTLTQPIGTDDRAPAGDRDFGEESEVVHPLDALIGSRDDLDRVLAGRAGEASVGAGVASAAWRLTQLASGIYSSQRAIGAQLARLNKSEIAIRAMLARFHDRVSARVEREYGRQMLLLGVSAVLLIAFVFATSLGVVVPTIRRISKIGDISRKVADGQLDVDVEVYAVDELGRLEKEFNTMIRRLDTSVSEQRRVERELRDLSRSLEEQVRSRTRALEAAKNDAEVANIAKSRFLGNMGHELRTPLNVIIGYGELLLEQSTDSGDTEAEEDLRKIVDAGRNLLGLIDIILDMAKLDTGRLETTVRTFDVSRLVSAVVASVAAVAADNGNRVTVRTDSAPERMTSDRARVRQVVMSLMSNAAKFTSEGEIDLDVSQVDRRGEPYLKVVVRDTGIGMTELQLKRVFQPFEQGDNSVNRVYGGSGLGLSICRRLCELLGGSVTLRSSKAEGTRATVMLPLVLAADSEEDFSTPVRDAMPLPLPARPSVLIIDDEIETQRMLQHHLERLDCKILTAATGERGLVLARFHRPSVILLDILMPDLDGWAVLGQLKADERTAGIPIIICTVTDGRQRSIDLGAADFIAKPVDRDRLLSAVRRCAPQEAGAVLIVDNDDLSRAVMAGVFRQEGWSVTEAGSGVDGLMFLDTDRPDLVILDLVMPGMDGFEFLETIRRDDALRAMPVVAVTDKALTDEDRECLRRSAARIVEKDAGTDLGALLRQTIEALAADPPDRAA
jgi:signal transduction histidine kinase/CheY-like chemotaxis protein